MTTMGVNAVTFSPTTGTINAVHLDHVFDSAGGGTP